MNTNMLADRTMAGRVNGGGGSRRSLWKGPALTAALLLVPPLLGSYFVEDWNWAPGAFVVLGILLFGMGFTYQLITRNRDAIAYRVALCLTFGASFGLTWSSFVQMADVTTTAAMYFVVPIVCGIGAIVARFKPNGMARALFAAALTQALIWSVALMMLITRKPQVASWTPPEWRGFGGNAVLVMVFIGAALLFRKAGREESAACAV